MSKEKEDKVYGYGVEAPDEISEGPAYMSNERLLNTAEKLINDADTFITDYDSTENEFTIKLYQDK